ncbi:MAG: glycosyltransferase [Roseiarcus sp.]|jgi:hypothetical protein|uniref:glycosyltransferase family protein n=1 Tax=Roseiarcus sp. TaxID=1969460 RepID=UPI003C1D6A4E
MVRIIHASNFGRKAKGAFQHAVEHKITNGLIRNGHAVSNFSDRDVARAGTLLGHLPAGAKAANRAFLDFCLAVGPDLIVLGHADLITAETLRRIRDSIPNLQVIQYDVDWLMEERNIRDILAKADVVDATLATTAGETLRRIFVPGKKLGFMPNPVDFSIESGHNHERRDLPFDLFYACGNELSVRWVCGRQTTAKEVLAAIEARIPGIRILSPGARGEPNFAGAKYQRALESAAVGLNLSRRNDIYLYTSDRLAHMAGNGLAVMLEAANGYQQFVPEGEFVYFRDFDEMIEKLRRLIAEPDYRQAVAAAGRSRYHDLFNEQVVARYLVDVAFDRLDPAAYPWPTLHAF